MNYRRELSVALAIVVLGVVLALARPAFFSAENLNDLFLANMAVLVCAVGATLVILVGEIDIAVGSTFAFCSVAAGVVATSGLPLPVAALTACVAGVVVGAVDGALVAFAGIPSIVVTLAAMIGVRDALRWATQGAWIENLPASFQWLGLTQGSYPMAMAALLLVLIVSATWLMSETAAGRAVYATGSNRRAATLVGLDPALVVFAVFAIAGLLAGLGALINAARFNQIPSNGGIGLEMKAIAAVVVGGTAISGGRGTMLGTVLGVVLLGAIGPALTFMGVSAYWERALHGAIILTAVAIDALRARRAVPTVTAARAAAVSA